MERRTIKIGSNELEAFFTESPSDGFTYTVEAHSRASAKFGQCFYPANLQGIRADAFPEGVDLAIYNVRRGFRYIDTIWVRKLNGICEVTNAIRVDFHSWDMPESLGNFVDRYIEVLQSEPLNIKVSLDKSEYGFHINSTVSVGQHEDILSVIQKLEAVQESTFKKQLLPSNAEPPKQYGQERRHWWIRYVIVPLVGSGAVAAVLANYLMR